MNNSYDEYITNENDSIFDECIVCCQSDENSKLYNYNHNCGSYKIHQKCLHEWLLKEGNSCIICRKDAFTNEETICFLNLLKSIQEDIENGSVTVHTKKMRYDNVSDNEPNFGIILDQNMITQINRFDSNLTIDANSNNIIESQSAECLQDSICKKLFLFASLLIIMGIILILNNV